MANRKAYRSINPHPCGPTQESKNTALTKETLEALDDLIPEDGFSEPSAGGGDGLVPFIVTANAESNPVSVKIADREQEPWAFEVEKQAYDPSERVFLHNFKVGHYGWCRLAPEIGDEAVEIVSMEGQIRFFTGTLATKVTDGEATANIDKMFGSASDGFDISTESAVDVFDRLGIMEDKPAGTKVLAIYDERENEYIIIGEQNTEGDRIRPFVVVEAGVNGACEVKLADMSESPWTFTIERTALDPFYYTQDGDPANDENAVARGVFFRNMKVGHYGFCREITHPTVENAVEILSLEGRARYITGTLADTMGPHAPLDVEFDFGAFPNSVPAAAQVTIHDRLKMMENQPIGTPALGLYDEDRDEYIAIGKPRQKFEVGTMHQINICDPITNSCCAFLGYAHKMIEVSSNTCGHTFCGEPCFVMCENYQLLPDTDYREETPAITDSYGNNIQDWCDWARKTGMTMVCNGAELPVYVIRCPCAPCVCPTPGQTIRAIYDPLDGLELGNPVPGTEPRCGFPNFDMKCVTRDPIELNLPGPNQEFWWGEFTVAGYYPYMGTPFDIEPAGQFDFNYIDDEGNPQTETIDIIYLVWLPKSTDPTDGGNYEFWFPYDGGYEKWAKHEGDLPLGDGLGGWEPILDDFGFVHLYPTYYRYGILGFCTSTDPDPSVNLFTIYHLRRDKENVLDGCDDMMVPQPDHEIQSDGMDEHAQTVSTCCQVSKRFYCDLQFGGANEWTVEAVEIDTNGLVIDIAYEFHILGGCRDHIAKSLQDLGYGDIVEFGDVNRGLSSWRVNWSGNPEKDLCPPDPVE